MGVYFGDSLVGMGGGGSQGGSSEIITVKPYMTEVTLSPGGWDSTSHTQTITIPGISDNKNLQSILITPVYESNNTEKIRECNVYAFNQIKNGIIFKCDSIPTTNVSFYIKWEQVSWI